MSSRAVRTGHARSGDIHPHSPGTAPVALFPTLARAPEVAPDVPARELWVGVHLPWLALEALATTEWEHSMGFLQRPGSEPAQSFSPSAGREGDRQPIAHKSALQAGRELVPPPTSHVLRNQASVAGRNISRTKHSPRAVVELEGQTQFVVALCERAERMGVRPGMSLAAALALVPQLETRLKEPPREARLLERLATLAQRFTPRVSLVPPDGLLLEVKGSLHLFGGAEGLCRAFEEECHAAGVRPLLSLAPVSLAALVGARVGKRLMVTQQAHLVGQLVSLPLMALRWPLDVLQRLKQVGVLTIGEALRLPRAGFARRFGKPQLAMLDRLTGRDADLRPRFQMRERFQRRHPLLYDVEHHESLLGALQPLLEELGAFLQARQCGVTRLECLLQHRHAPVTRCVLRLAAPAASASHFIKLFGEKLATLSLPESVRALELRTGGLVSRAPAENSLWQAGEYGGGVCAESPELIEHLRARLGNHAVYGLKMLACYRPETAWGATELTRSKEPSIAGRLREKKNTGAAPPAQHGSVMSEPPWAAFQRPVWLLGVPRRLREREGMPRRRGALKLLGGPERIETAWWDGGDITRDYYRALDSHGVQLWVFRERTPPHRWFLQGVFG